jgi:hypothetical protein
MKINEIAIMQEKYAELCRIMQNYAFSGRIALAIGNTKYLGEQRVL